MTGLLSKIKRPQGPFTYEFTASDQDRFGHWLYLPHGSGWTAPHDSGALPFDVVVRLTIGSPLVMWWCDDPADQRIEIDVSLPAVATNTGWSFTDLELDVTQHADGSVLVEDEDEFVAACRAGHITPAEAALAQQACADGLALLQDVHAQIHQAGWLRLKELNRARRP